MKLFKSSILAAIALLGVATTACSDSNSDYIPGAQSTGVYFPVIEGGQITLTKTDTSFDVSVARSGSDLSAATYKVYAAADTLIFTVPSEVSFAEGDKSAKLSIKYDAGRLGTGSAQTISLKFADDAVISSYGKSSISFDVIVPVNWGPFSPMMEGTGTFIWNLWWSGEEAGLPVDIRTDEDNEFHHQVRVGKWSTDEADDSKIDFYIEVDTSTGESLVKPQYIGESYGSYGKIYVADMYTFITLNGPLPLNNGGQLTAEDVKGASSYNPDNGTFSLYLMYYVSAGYLGANYEFLVVDGIKDYSVSLAYTGVLTNPDATESNAVFNVAVGPDASEARVAMALTEVEIDDIIQGLIDETIPFETVGPGESTVQIPFEETGDFYAVAAVFKGAGNEFVDYDAVEFTFGGAGGGDFTPEWEDAGFALCVDGWSLYPYAFGQNREYTYEDVVWQCAVQKNTKQAGKYRIMSMFTDPEGPHVAMGLNKNTKTQVNVVVDAANPECFVLEPQYSGMDVQESQIYGDNNVHQMYIANFGGLYRAQGADDAYTIESGYNDVLDLESGIAVIKCPWFGFSADFLNDDTWGYWPADDQGTPASYSLIYLSDMDPNGDPNTAIGKKMAAKYGFENISDAQARTIGRSYIREIKRPMMLNMPIKFQPRFRPQR